MRSHDTQKNDQLSEKDKFRFYLALSTNKVDSHGACFSDDILISLAKGILNSKKRKDVLGHLNNCPECYQKWVDMPPVEQPENLFIVLKKKLSLFIDLIINLVEDTFLTKRYFLSPALAVATCCIIFVIVKLINSNDLQSYISQSYQTIAQQSIQIEKHYLPWEQKEKAFASSKKKSPAKTAFTAGLIHGKKTLIKDYKADDAMNLLSQWKNDVEDKSEESHIYFVSGEFLFLLQSTGYINYKFSESFWKKQNSIIEIIQTSLSKFKSKQKYAEKLSDGLKQINDQIKTVLETNLLKNQKKIANQASYLIERLSLTQIK
ncbi:hypothetical protein MHK_011008 [Candidatus Magnetomorum sp. HK-1]|nr:hypothetical protein MHK_011008 [Candidatus Magnetomorum sp. HK-1]